MTVMIVGVLFFILGLIGNQISVNIMPLAGIESNLRLPCNYDFKKYINKSIKEHLQK
jgi:hypothetical protein